MPAKVIVTGNLGQDPDNRTLKDGRPITSLSIAATAAQKHRTTGQWSDIGDPLWIRAAFFGDEADRLADTLHKGDKVTIEGTLVLRTFTRKDGGEGSSLELHYPRFLGVVPRGPRQARPVSQGTFTPPADDPWGNPAGEEAPF